MVKPPKEYVRCPMCNHLVDPFRPKNLDMRELRFGVWRKTMLGYKNIRWEQVDQGIDDRLNLVLTWKQNCELLLGIIKRELADIEREKDRVEPDLWVDWTPRVAVEAPVGQIDLDVRW